MLLNLSDLSSEPLQQQIIRQIRAKILSSELSPGIELPSIRALARDQHISVITVKRAYEILERAGFIHSRRGKGFFISEIKDDTKKEIAKNRLIENLEPIFKSALLEGLTADEILTTAVYLINHSLTLHGEE